MVGDSVTTDHISPAGSIKKDSPAGRFLTGAGVATNEFNSYGARRGNDRVMTRGTFANIRLKNQLAPGTEGGVTTFPPGGEVMSIYDASKEYEKQGTPLVVLAGKDYGMGSSRDWAAKGTFLLGVRVVIAESYERIHRSNLVGMGVLPLVYKPGETRQTLGLDGTEAFDVKVGDDLRPGQDVPVTATKADGRHDRRVHRRLPDRHAGGDRLLPQRRHPADGPAAAAGGRGGRMSPTTLLPPPRPARPKAVPVKPAPSVPATPPTATPTRQVPFGLHPPIGGPDGGAGILPDPAGWPALVRITVDQYHDWVERGLLPTNPTVELIDGLLVRKDRSHAGDDPMSIGIRHANGVENVRDLTPRLLPLGCVARSQQPVVLPGVGVPEPDGTIALGTRETYRDRHPTAADVACVVEVSDASLANDQTVKLLMYATAGLPQYVILNLRDDVVEDYRDPTPDGYGEPTVRRRGESVTFRLAGDATLDVAVDELLP